MKGGIKRKAGTTTKRAGTRASAAGAAKARARPARGSASAGSVRAYVSALAPSHRAAAERFDALVERVVPGVQRVIKWGMPFYGRVGRGWFVSCGVVRGEIRVTFFQGRSLRPVPPEGSGQPRGIEVTGPGSFDDDRLESWVRQAARLPGFGS
jgi:hypothetical protein